MLRNSTILILVLFIARVNGYGQKTDSKAKDEAMIRANVEQMAKGWNMKSGAEFAKPFAEDSDYVVVNGMHIKGRRQNASAHQQIFDTFYKGTKLWVRVKSVRLLKPDVMLVHSVSKVLKPGDSDASPEPEAIQTWLVSKHGNEWLIDAFHNTPIQRQGVQDAKP